MGEHTITRGTRLLYLEHQIVTPLLDAGLGTNLHLLFVLLFPYLTVGFQAKIGIVGIYTKQK